jgi:DNA-binding NarL/FixJ family response regulator
MKRVLIADDHAIHREGLKLLISKTVDMVVTDEAENGQEALKKIMEGDFDLVILDISMPGRNGLEVLSDIKRAKPKLPVLILSMHPEEQYALHAFKAGASGYLTKGSPSPELFDALQKVALGKRYITPSMADAMAERLATTDNRPLHETLSIREYQIMGMIAAGEKPQQIAKELFMSVKTVATYRTRILTKMNMKSNIELARYAMEHKIV